MPCGKQPRIDAIRRPDVNGHIIRLPFESKQKASMIYLAKNIPLMR